MLFFENFLCLCSLTEEGYRIADVAQITVAGGTDGVGEDVGAVGAVGDDEEELRTEDETMSRVRKHRGAPSSSYQSEFQ